MTEYQEVGEQSVSSGHAHLEAEGGYELEETHVVGTRHLSWCSPSSEDDPFPWLSRLGLAPEAAGVTVDGGGTPVSLTPGSLSSCHNIWTRMSGLNGCGSCAEHQIRYSAIANCNKMGAHHKKAFKLDEKEEQRKRTRKKSRGTQNYPS